MFHLRRRRTTSLEDILRKHPDLMSDEREILRFIVERGGKALESEIRDAFKLPRSSVWRVAKRLERMGIVVIRKVGVHNQIELKK